MKQDVMFGYFIQALKNIGLSKTEIEKILQEIYKLQEEISEQKAQGIYYDFPE